MIILHSYSYLLKYGIYTALFQKVFLSHFFAILFFEVLRGVQVLAIRKKRASESSDRRRVLKPKVTRVVTFGTLRYFNSSSFKRVKAK